MSATFVRVDYQNDDHTKQLLTRPNQHGIGIDLGWRIWAGHPDSECWVETWWGNTKDAMTLRQLIEDPALHRTPFVLSAEAQTLTAAKRD